MLKRFVLAALVVAGGLGSANGQVDPSIKPAPHHADADRARGPVRRSAETPTPRKDPPPQKEWAEQVIDKFLAIPEEIFDPQPLRRP